MALRTIGRPVIPPKPMLKDRVPAVRETVRKPEPGLRQMVRPGLDAPKGDEDDKESFTTSFRMNGQLNALVETIMATRDCRKSDAVKYAIRVVGHALRQPEASLTVVNSAGVTEITPLMRNGEPC